MTDPTNEDIFNEQDDLHLRIIALEHRADIAHLARIKILDQIGVILNILRILTDHLSQGSENTDE